MENILKIMQHNITMFFKESWGSVFLILPIVISVMSVKVFDVDKMSLDGTISIYAETDNQEMMEILEERINRTNISVNLVDEQEEARKAVEEDKASLAMIVKDKDMLKSLMSGKMDIEVIYKEEKINAEIIKEKIRTIMQEMQLLALKSEGDQEGFKKLYHELESKSGKIAIRENNSSYLANKQAFGIFAMLLLMSGGYGLRVMAREKELRVYERIGMSPVKRYEYILGHVGGSLAILSIQVILEWLVLSGLKINFNLSMGIFLAIGLTLMLISVGVTLFLLALSSNANVFNMMLGFVVPPMAMLSDCIFPIEFLPEWIDKVSLISPIRWVMEAYNIALLGENIGKVMSYLGLGCILAIVLILLSIVIEGQKKVRIS